MSEQVLSSEELGALMQSATTPVEEAPAAPGEVRSYDLNSHDRVVRGRLPAMEMVNERFVRQWRGNLGRMLRRGAEVTVLGLETLKFNEYMNSLQMPSNINMVRVKSLRGTALVTLEPALVYAAVDNYFGGVGKGSSEPSVREFTATEMRVVRLILQTVFVDLAEAWAPVSALEFEYTGSETNPHFATVVTPREHIVVSRFRVELAGGGGELHIAMPWDMLEPMRETLVAPTQGDRAERDEKWSRALRNRFVEASVEPRGVLYEIKSNLRQLLRYRAGDILPVDAPGLVDMKVDGVVIFRGRFGVSGGKCAVKITEFIQRPADGGQNPGGIP